MGSGDLGQNVAVDAPGVTDSAINFAVLGTETGNPFGTCLLKCFTDGIEAYFEYRNTESDGIYGRKLEATQIVDDEFGEEPGEGAGDHLGRRHLRHVLPGEHRHRLG